jgi:hypothetical protein
MKEKVDRKRLIKGGAGGALALGLLGAGAAPAAARGGHDDDDDDDDDERRGLHIHIHGVLSGVSVPSTVKLAVNIDVAGRRNDLAGAGWDSGTGTEGPSGMKPGGDPPAGPVGMCYYTASGSLDDRTLKLVGRSLLTNRPLATADAEDPGKSDTRADGRNFDATVDVRTGAITWSLSPGGATFAGKALVVVTRGGRTSRP